MQFTYFAVETLTRLVIDKLLLRCVLVKYAYVIFLLHPSQTHPLCHYLTVRSLLAAGGFSEALQLLTLVENDNSLSQTARNITIDSPSEGPVDPDCPKNVSKILRKVFRSF